MYRKCRCRRVNAITRHSASTYVAFRTQHFSYSRIVSSFAMMFSFFLCPFVTSLLQDTSRLLSFNNANGMVRVYVYMYLHVCVNQPESVYIFVQSHVIFARDSKKFLLKNCDALTYICFFRVQPIPRDIFQKYRTRARYIFRQTKSTYN